MIVGATSLIILPRLESSDGRPVLRREQRCDVGEVAAVQQIALPRRRPRRVGHMLAEQQPDPLVAIVTILRKEPTFNEADHGFRAFGELLRALATDGIVELEGRGDAMVSLPALGTKETDAMVLLQQVVQAG